MLGALTDQRLHACAFAAKLGASGVVAAILVAVVIAMPAAAGASPAVLLVGDSWAKLMYDNGSLSTMFAGHGHPEIAVYGDTTTIDGSTAAEWADSSMLVLLDDALAAHPEIEVVVLFLGGNDLLAGQSGGGWYVGMDPADEAQLFADIQGHLEVVVDHLLLLNPDLWIVLSSYDYPNFVDTLGGVIGLLVCLPLWNDLNQPTPLEINSETARLDLVHAAIAATRPSVARVAHWGLMQYLFGYPPLQIDPGVLLPPGDPTLPSPTVSLRWGVDCFHLNPTGYEGISERLWSRTLEWHYDGTFSDGFESGDVVGWSSSAGASP